MDWLGWFYLAFATASLAFVYFVDWRTPDRIRREMLCDRQDRDCGDAYFIRTAGDAYVTECFGPALPI